MPPNRIKVMNSLTDTSPDCEQVLMDVYRRTPVGQKWLRLGKAFQEAKALHAAGVRFRNPKATRQEVHSNWLELHFGSRMLAINWGLPVNPAVENLRVFREVVAVF